VRLPLPVEAFLVAVLTAFFPTEAGAGVLAILNVVSINSEENIVRKTQF
jgi:hypothetical protein